MDEDTESVLNLSNNDQGDTFSDYSAGNVSGQTESYNPGSDAGDDIASTDEEGQLVEDKARSLARNPTPDKEEQIKAVPVEALLYKDPQIVQQCYVTVQESEKEKAEAEAAAEKWKADAANLTTNPASAPGPSTLDLHSIEAQQVATANMFTPPQFRIREMELDEK